MGRLIACVAALLALTACGPGTGLVVVGANVVSLVNTDKTLVDHAASWATDEDCSAIAFSNKEEYCQSKEFPVEPAAAAETFCYRSLGSIVCYNEPDPYASEQMRVL
jgi:hypothetical protein